MSSAAESAGRDADTSARSGHRLSVLDSFSTLDPAALRDISRT